VADGVMLARGGVMLVGDGVRLARGGVRVVGDGVRVARGGVMLVGDGVRVARGGVMLVGVGRGPSTTRRSRVRWSSLWSWHPSGNPWMRCATTSSSRPTLDDAMDGSLRGDTA